MLNSTPLQLVVFDWAGTTVDFGSCSPIAAFLATFQKADIEVSEAQLRQFMGKHKKEHLRAVLDLPEVRQQWKTKYKRDWTQQDLDNLFEQYLPSQLEVLPDFAHVIDEVPNAVETLRSKDLRIGSSTGYTREMLNIVERVAAQEGYQPDYSITVSEAPGRPSPFMALRNAEHFGVYPLRSVVKVGDTPTDIHEGLNGGMWTIGVAGTGNEIGMGRQDFEALPPGDQHSLLQRGRQRLRDAGAHFIVDTLDELPDLIDTINQLLKHNAKP